MNIRAFPSTTSMPKVFNCAWISMHGEGAVLSVALLCIRYLSDAAYVRWSITFILFKGSELAPMTLADDEELLSRAYPSQVGQHCAAVGPALVAHYG